MLVFGGGDSAVEAALALAQQPGNRVRLSYRGEAFSRIKPANQEMVSEASSRGRLEILWRTLPAEVAAGTVRLRGEGDSSFVVPADEVFVFLGGELPTRFLADCGVEVETHFGRPR